MPEQQSRGQRADHFKNVNILAGFVVWFFVVVSVAAYLGFAPYKSLVAHMAVAGVGKPGEDAQAARDFLSAAGTGAAFLIGLYLLIWGAGTRHRQMEAAQQQVKVAQETQLTGFLTKAVEQLGATREETLTVTRKSARGHKDFTPQARHVIIPELRLGAIAALERIAITDDKEPWPIVDMLAAYARKRSSERFFVLKAREALRAADDEKGDEVEPLRDEPEQYDPETYKEDVRAAFLAIARILGKPTQRADHGSSVRTELRHADLTGLILPGVELEDVVVSRCLLDKCELAGARVLGVVFERVWMGSRADLSNIKILTDRVIGDGRIRPPVLFRDCNIVTAKLPGAVLPGCRFENAEASEANFTGAMLTDMVARGRTKFIGTDFTGATLHRADFGDSDVTAAIFKGADLTGAKISQTQIDSAIGDKGTKGTKLPTGKDPPAHWLEAATSEPEADADGLP